MDFRVLFEGRDQLHEGSLRALTGAGESPADRRLAEVALVSSEPAFWEPYICALYYAEAAGIYDPARALDELAARIALSAAATPEGRINVTDPRLTCRQGPARLSAGLQRAGRHQRAPSRPGCRDRDRRRRLRTPRTDARRRPTRACGGRHPILIPPDTSRRRTTRRNWDGGRYDQMRQVLASDPGGELYRKRQPMIEPVFVQMKYNRGLDRFRRRGRGAVRAEWRLITATHNLLKLHRHALAAA